MSTRGGRILSRATWFGLFYAASFFVIFQEMEDCETSADQPGCCNYPSIVVHGEDHLHCDKSLRCLHKHEVPIAEEEVYCALDEAEHHERLGQAPNIVFNSTFCDELRHRWEEFSSSGGLKYEVQEEEAREAMTFRLFETVGQAASVEMYFTILGVLLKVLFLTQHPNSEAILHLEQHHHTVVNGENTVVSARRSSAHWNVLRNAVRAQGFLHRVSLMRGGRESPSPENEETGTPVAMAE